MALDDGRLTVTDTGLHFAELVASIFDVYTNENLLARLGSN